MLLGKASVPGSIQPGGDCEDQTKGYNNAKYKKFPTRAQAEAFVRGEDEPAGAAESTAGRSVGQQPSGSVIVSPDADIEGDVVYSDGACKGNGQRGSVAGIGVWWGPNDARCVMSLPHPGRYMTVTTRNIAERCPGDQTNNRAELIAILRVLEETPVSKTPLLIKTDSQYSIKCFEQWIKNWKRNGWKNSKGEPVKNDGIIRLIEAHLDRRGKFGQKVRFAYVKGHSGDVGNDGADYQANLGAMMPFVAERDWKEDLEELLMDTLLEEAERETAPAPPPEARKRSRVSSASSPVFKRSRTLLFTTTDLEDASQKLS
ncbi:ribonuclease H-like domain-containing protein [Ephemerocybe angulata]|uniref:ribonuclease H n=1 Tax=Ephemerocybe angulata TaxID=980116 RepID=A0A8H6HWU5_9AGAR|nr:ribonuclease H-like domain-containing protein [Tulosesus angulatus]